MAASLASVPLLQEEALGIEPAVLDQGLGEQSLRLHVPGVGDVDEPGRLLLYCRTTRGGQWPIRSQPQPGKKSR